MKEDCEARAGELLNAQMDTKASAACHAITVTCLISLILLLQLVPTSWLKALRNELKEHAERQQQEGERCGMHCSLTLLAPGTLQRYIFHRGAQDGTPSDTGEVSADLTFNFFVIAASQQKG